ncbi:MAG TPA: hypothetical protein VGO16_10955 [Pseudonocardiaceae bacterium]|nr:hypothetical protein [Pseudonocardiaceae bacterium]
MDGLDDARWPEVLVGHERQVRFIRHHRADQLGVLFAEGHHGRLTDL